MQIESHVQHGFHLRDRYCSRLNALIFLLSHYCATQEHMEEDEPLGHSLPEWVKLEYMVCLKEPVYLINDLCTLWDLYLNDGILILFSR